MKPIRQMSDEPWKFFAYTARAWQIVPIFNTDIAWCNTSVNTVRQQIIIWDTLHIRQNIQLLAMKIVMFLPAWWWYQIESNLNEIWTFFTQMIAKYAPGPWFSIKMSSYQYRKSHCGDKMVVRSSNLHNGIYYTGKMVSLYRYMKCLLWVHSFRHREIHRFSIYDQ